MKIYGCATWHTFVLIHIDTVAIGITLIHFLITEIVICVCNTRAKVRFRLRRGADIVKAVTDRLNGTPVRVNGVAAWDTGILKGVHTHTRDAMISIRITSTAI